MDRRIAPSLALCALLLAALGQACSSSDSGPVDAGPVLTDAGCYLAPQTHDQIINACTTALAIDKHPTLPLLYPDGGLPPLP